MRCGQGVRETMKEGKRSIEREIDTGLCIKMK